MSGKAAQSTAATTPGGTPGAAASPTGGIGAAAGPWGMAAEAGLGIGMSLFQASEQAAIARNMQERQNKAMEEAKRLAGANYLQNVSVPTEAYQAGMREATAQQMQALQAGTEGDVRNLQGIVGRANEQAIDATFQEQDKMAKDLYNLNIAQAQEQKNSANALAGIGLQEAQGAGLAKQQAEAAKFGAYTNVAKAGLRIGAGLDQMQAFYPTQKAAQSVAPYNVATDPLLNSAKANMQVVGPQVDARGYSPIGERFPGVSQIDWSLFKE